jgi:parallel beta-helix repeat protein
VHERPHISRPHPAASESHESEFPIPRYLWITGITVALAVLAFTGGAMIRRFGAKPEPAMESTAPAPLLPRTTGAALVPDKFPTIQAAIDSVQSGETITLRPGVYRESITLKDGVRIVGEKQDACRILPPDGAAALVLARGVRQCIIENLTLDGSEVKDRAARTDGIAISDAEITVSGCIIRGMTGSGIVVHGSDTAAEISANRIENNGLHGILLLRTGSNAALRKNEIRQSKGAGISFNEGAAGLAEENVCEENGDSGILAAGVATSPSLQSNRCNHNENHGISFMGAARGSVTGNTCNENGESGLAAIGEGTAPEFVKNTARRNVRYGIYIATGADGDATGNICEANQLSGIGVTGTSTRPALSGNQLVRNQKFGIESSNGASPRIAPDNTFSENLSGDISR